jgi:hypothetical protein
VVGGIGDGGALTSAELYDPAENTWSPAGSMSVARRGSATATLLPSGQVLVAGGDDAQGNPLASAELYDPASNSWSPAASMATGRVRHTATLLSTGKVLVAGGDDAFGNSLAGAELYAPGPSSAAPAPVPTAAPGIPSTPAPTAAPGIPPLPGPMVTPIPVAAPPAGANGWAPLPAAGAARLQ